MFCCFGALISRPEMFCDLCSFRSNQSHREYCSDCVFRKFEWMCLQRQQWAARAHRLHLTIGRASGALPHRIIAYRWIGIVHVYYYSTNTTNIHKDVLGHLATRRNEMVIWVILYRGMWACQMHLTFQLSRTGPLFLLQTDAYTKSCRTQIYIHSRRFEGEVKSSYSISVEARSQTWSVLTDFGQHLDQAPVHLDHTSTLIWL